MLKLNKAIEKLEDEIFSEKNKLRCVPVSEELCNEILAHKIVALESMKKLNRINDIIHELNKTYVSGTLTDELEIAMEAIWEVL